MILQKAKLERDLIELETISRVNSEIYLMNSKKTGSNSMSAIQRDEILEEKHERLPEIAIQFKPLPMPDRRSLNDKIYLEVQQTVSLKNLFY